MNAHPVTAERSISGSTCPFLASVPPDAKSVFPHGVVCRVRRQQRRPPSAEEFAWFCSTTHFHACPTYRPLMHGEEP